MRRLGVAAIAVSYRVRTASASRVHRAGIGRASLAHRIVLGLRMAEVCHGFKTMACHHAVAIVTAPIFVLSTVPFSPVTVGVSASIRALHTFSGGQTMKGVVLRKTVAGCVIGAGCAVGMPVLACAQAAAAAAADATRSNENSNDHNTKTPIKHVIYIIGENRTFDHGFATFVPREGQTVWNLLSEGIIRADGRPGPNWKLAQQWQAAESKSCAR